MGLCARALLARNLMVSSKFKNQGQFTYMSGNGHISKLSLVFGIVVEAGPTIPPANAPAELPIALRLLLNRRCLHNCPNSNFGQVG
jgi:hypothetical protein